MSDVVETQPLKIKRVYKKKNTNTPVEETFTDVPSGYVPEVVESIEKPKRKYTRKPSSSPDGSLRDRGKETPAVEKAPEPEPTIPEPTPFIPTPETSSDEDDKPLPKEKKPRTDKQIQAFNRMREARLKKQAELNHLKELSKQQVLLDKEQAKLEKVEDKIIKQKAKRAPKAKKEPAPEYNEPPPYVNVTSLNKLVFV